MESIEADSQSTAIPASLYIQRIASLHADGDVGFSKEFQAIQAIENSHAEAMKQNNAKSKAKQKPSQCMF